MKSDALLAVAGGASGGKKYAVAPSDSEDEGSTGRTAPGSFGRAVTTPATVVLLFNCHNAAFEVTKWTGKDDFNKLSGESSFDLISRVSKKRMGRVKLANELGS